MSRPSLKVQLTKSTSTIQVWDIVIEDINIIKAKVVDQFSEASCTRRKSFLVYENFKNKRGNFNIFLVFSIFKNTPL